MLERLKRWILRVRSSAVFWSWGMNGLRLASGLLLLPLLTLKLSKPEFGMYYVFLSVIGLIPLMDLGLSSSMGRFVSYALAGAKELKPEGLPEAVPTGSPNYQLLWQLLSTTRRIYGFVTLLGFFVMGIWGTILVSAKVHEIANPRFVWIAWGVTLAGAMYELYSYWWNSYLCCLDKVQEGASILFFAQSLRLIVSCVLLASGLGLLSVPIGTFAASILGRFYSKKAVLRTLGEPPEGVGYLKAATIVQTVWPNAWRLALQGFSSYLRTNALVQICVTYFGLSITGEYGLSVQVLNIAAGMAMVWTSVKWPRVAQLRARHDIPGLRALLWPRLWLQNITFVLIGAAAIVAGQMLLQVAGTDKRLLPTDLLIMLFVTGLLDVNFYFWGSLLAAENRIPTLWSTVATNIIILAATLLIIEIWNTGVMALGIAPLIVGCGYLYWHWPRAGAASLQTTWMRFMLKRY